jgi:hypothetical protein
MNIKRSAGVIAIAIAMLTVSLAAQGTHPPSPNEVAAQGTHPPSPNEVAAQGTHPPSPNVWMS